MHKETAIIKTIKIYTLADMAEIDQSEDIAWKSIYDDDNLYSCQQYGFAEQKWDEYVKDN